tara:strand:- start:52 stop:651 length:600 start_codon:yes stop_codon:yes gene_type:complete
MKITKTKLKQIIKEEISDILSEAYYTTVGGEHTRTHLSDEEKQARSQRDADRSARFRSDLERKQDWDHMDHVTAAVMKEMYALRLIYGQSLEDLEGRDISGLFTGPNKNVTEVAYELAKTSAPDSDEGAIFDNVSREDVKGQIAETNPEHWSYVLDRAEQEGNTIRRRPAGGGLGGPGGKARYPTRKEIEAAHRYEDNK